MHDTYEVTPCPGPIHATVRPPGSKSITNRALVCAALAEGQSMLTGALDSDDTRVMIDGLNAVGIEVTTSADRKTLCVLGTGGDIPANRADLFIGNSGTTVRFLTAMLTLGEGTYRLDGVPRMRERPIGQLLETLNALGAHVRCENRDDCPPVMVRGAGLPGGDATIAGDISSQYLSGILMAAPGSRDGVSLRVAGTLVSRPYVTMTCRVMESFGVKLEQDSAMGSFDVKPQAYRATQYGIEPDASAASYFWAAAAITGGSVAVEGLSRDALQGDVQFVDCLEKMGCNVVYGDDRIQVDGPSEGLRGICCDMNAISDTAQTLSVVALFANAPTEITGIGHNRHKETDRIGNLATELRKLGATVDETPGGMKVTPGKLRPASIATYDDHRMAMSLALAGLRQPGVVIEDPGCVSKTYPDYFKDLRAATSS